MVHNQSFSHTQKNRKRVNNSRRGGVLNNQSQRKSLRKSKRPISTTKRTSKRMSNTKRTSKRMSNTKRKDQNTLKEFHFLQKFIKNIQFLEKINEKLTDCSIPKSGSGQLIKICPQFVYKGPSVKYQSKNTICWDKAKKSIKIDFYSINLLIQTALKIALKKEEMSIRDILKQFNLYKLVSNVVMLPFQLFEIIKHVLLHMNMKQQQTRRNMSRRRTFNGKIDKQSSRWWIGKEPVRIEHWDSIVRDESNNNNWYMKSKKCSFNDPRFDGVFFTVKDGSIYDKGAPHDAYNRLFMNSPTEVTLTDVQGNPFSVKCCYKSNKLEIVENKSFKDGKYAVSKSLLNIKEYLRLSIPSDVNSDEFLCQSMKWFNQIRYTLEWTYDKIQLHHCDVKAEQFLLDEEGNAIVSDLDKATFTVYNDLTDKPVRIRLHRNECEKGRVMNKLLHSAKNIRVLSKYLPVPTSMQFEPYPRKNVDYECLCYLSSYLLLVGGEQNIDVSAYVRFSKKLIELCNINCSVFKIDIKRLILTRKSKWAYRKDFQPASSCVVYSEESMRKLKGRNAKYTPKWNESVLNLQGELQSTVSLREISDTIEREYNHQKEDSRGIFSFLKPKASIARQPQKHVNTAIYHMKEQINEKLESASLPKLDKVILLPYMSTYILGGPEHLDKTLYRFLESEKQDVTEAAEKFYNAILWRQKLKIEFDKNGNIKHTLTEDQFDNIYQHLELRWWVKDNQVHYYEKYGDFIQLKSLLDPKTWHDDILLYRILALEYQSHYMNTQDIDTHRIKSYYNVSEMNKKALLDRPIQNVIKRLVIIGDINYPELLDKAYIENPHVLVKMIIGIIKSLLNETTRDKINITNDKVDMPQNNDNEFKNWCFRESESKKKTVNNNESIPNSWIPLIGNEFKVRGPNYFTNKKKIESESALFDCECVKLLMNDVDLSTECKDFYDKKKKQLVIRMKIAKSDKSLLICFQRDKDVNEKDKDVYDTFIEECRNMEINDHLPAKRFKVIIKNIKGASRSVMLLKGIFELPTIVEKFGYFEEKEMPVITIDADRFDKVKSYLTESYLKNNLKIGNCQINAGFVIQANTKEELPERMLGCVQFNKVNLDKPPLKFVESCEKNE